MKKMIVIIIKILVVLKTIILCLKVFIDNPITRLIIAITSKYSNIFRYVIHYIPNFIVDMLLLGVCIVAAISLNSYFPKEYYEGEN